MRKWIVRLFTGLGLTYVSLFLVFFFDLDGKFLYYVWEPAAIRHYDALSRRDMTKTPYETPSEMPQAGESDAD